MASAFRIVLIFAAFLFCHIGIGLALPVDHGKTCRREGKEGTVRCDLESTNWCHCCISGTCYSHDWTLAKATAPSQGWLDILTIAPDSPVRPVKVLPEFLDNVQPQPADACEPQSEYDYCRKADGGRKLECRGVVTRIQFDRRDFDRTYLNTTPVRPDGSYACTATLQVANPNNPNDGEPRSIQVRLSGKSAWHRDFCHLLKDAYFSNGPGILVYDIAAADPTCSSNVEPYIFLIGFPDLN